jgi:ubiquitin-protein ligase
LKRKKNQTARPKVQTKKKSIKMGESSQAALLLRKQLAELNKCPVEGFSAGLIDEIDIFKWEVLIIGPSDTLYEGGFFKCHLIFPKEYPLRPPKLKVITEIWHPNIEKKWRCLYFNPT